MTGGLVARGDGPWFDAVTGGRRRDDDDGGGPGEAPGENKASLGGEPGPRLKPAELDAVGEVAGGLPAEVDGMGGEPELNSANLGHLRLVSARSGNTSIFEGYTAENTVE